MSTTINRDIASRTPLALYQDTFNRSGTAGNSTVSNAAGWGTTASDGEVWTKTTGSGASFSIQTNGSTQVGQITNTTNIVVCLLGSNTVANVGAVTQFAFSSTTDEGGMILRYPSSGNQYRIKYNGNGKLIIAKVVLNSITSLANANFTITANTLYTMRVLCVGSTLAAKIWASSSTEPAGWTLALNDTAFTAAGQFGLYCTLASSGDTAQFANFAVYDAPGISQDISTRTRLSALTTKDISSRTILGALSPRDIASRVRVRAQPLRDVKTRFVLQTNGAKDLFTRFILGARPLRDVSSRTPVAIAQDTFNRSNTSGSTSISNTNGWDVFASDGEVWTKTGPGSSFSIQTNGSTQTGQITGTTNVVICQLGRSTLDNGGALTLLAVSDTGDEAGIVLRYPSGGNQYRFCYKNGTVQIRKNIALMVTQLATSAFTLTPGTLYYLRAYAAGSTLAVKMWAYGTSEPAGWTLATSDGSFFTGQFGLYCALTAGGHTAQFANFAAYDAPGTAQNLVTRFILGARVAQDLATRFLLGFPHVQDISSRSNTAIAQDTFNRAGTSGNTSISDPQGWSTASDGETWSKTGPGSTFQIVTNGSTQTGQITGTTNVVVCQLGSTSLTNAGALTLLAVSSTSDEAGIVLRYPSGGNQYRFCYKNGTVQIRKNVINVVTQLATSAFTLTPGSLYYIRALASGSTLAVKIWALGTSEPTSWTLTASDGSLQAGQFGLYCGLASSGHTAQFANFAAYDAPGTVRDLFTRLILLGRPLRDVATRMVLTLSRVADLATRSNMAIAQDTFNRAGTAGNTSIANAAGWGTTASDGETWSKNATGGAGVSFSIQTNGSTQVGQITGTTGVVVCTLGNTSLLNAGALVLFAVSSTNDEAGIILRFSSGGNQYRFCFKSGTFQIRCNAVSTVSGLVSTPFTLTPNTLYYLRAQTTSTALFAKIWPLGASEPARWSLPLVSDTTLGVGQFGLYANLANTGHTAQFANFAAYDAPAQNWDIATRLILRSSTLRDLATRLRLSSSLTQHDVGARLFLRPPMIPIPVIRDVSTRLLLQALPPLPAPGASGVQNNLFFSGEGLPVVLPPPSSSFAYTVNGVALADIPVVATAPGVSGSTVSAGSVFTLLFANPSSATQTALADGQVVSLTFVLANGQIVTGQVRLASTTTTTIAVAGTSSYAIRAFGSTLTLAGGMPDQTITLFQVQCTLTQNLVINTRRVQTQFL